MPNWCNNIIEISGEQEEIDKLYDFLEKSEGADWFDFFLPMPKEKKDEWYEWAIENWGCKWNCQAEEWEKNENCIEFRFDSPWGPPIQLYEYISNLGFTLDAKFLEEGVGLVGQFIDGYEESYNYDISDPDSLDEISDELVEYWDLRSLQEDYLASQEEPEDEE